MSFITTAKKSYLNNMNVRAKLAGLGDLLGVNVAAAGTFTTAGGDVTESIPVTGAVATDLAFVTIKTVGATPRTIISQTAATDAITVVFSGDPSTDHVVQWFLVRVV